MTESNSQYNFALNFFSINKLRKDIKGYLVPYELQISYVSEIKDQNYQNKELEITIKRNIISKIEGKNLLSVVSKTDTESFLLWIVRSIKKIFPQKGITITEVKLNEIGYKIESLKIHNKEEDKIVYLSKNGIEINGNFILTKDLSNSSQIRLFKKCLNYFFLKSNSGQQNTYTSKADWESITKKIDDSKKSEIILNTYVCPPYINTPGKGYTGLFSSIFEDPKKYNFDYDYHKQFRICENISLLSRSIGISVKSNIIFCDWGLININGIRSTLPTDKDIVDRLSSFYSTLLEVRDAYEYLDVVRLSQLGIDKYFPIGLPHSAQERKIFIENLDKQITHPIFNYLEWSFLHSVLGWVDDYNLIKYQDWKNFKDLEGSKLFKQEFIQLLKTYNNILWIRVRQLKSNANSSDLISDENKQLRMAAFYDALLRLIEYKIYGNLVSDRYKNSICLYLDPGFTMAGNHFRNKNLPILFIDPEMAHKNIKFQ